MQQGRRRVLRQLGLGAAGAALAGTAWTARAQGAAYPGRTVRIVMPYAAGGTGDVVARTIADGLAKAWWVTEGPPGAPDAGQPKASRR